MLTKKCFKNKQTWRPAVIGKISKVNSVELLGKICPKRNPDSEQKTIFGCKDSFKESTRSKDLSL